MNARDTTSLNIVQPPGHSIGDWRHMVTPGGTHEEPFPPPNGVMKMRRLIVEAIDRVPMGEMKGDA